MYSIYEFYLLFFISHYYITWKVRRCPPKNKFHLDNHILIYTKLIFIQNCYNNIYLFNLINLWWWRIDFPNPASSRIYPSVNISSALHSTTHICICTSYRICVSVCICWWVETTKQACQDEEFTLLSLAFLAYMD